MTGVQTCALPISDLTAVAFALACSSSFARTAAVSATWAAWVAAGTGAETGVAFFGVGLTDVGAGTGGAAAGSMTASSFFFLTLAFFFGGSTAAAAAGADADVDATGSAAGARFFLAGGGGGSTSESESDEDESADAAGMTGLERRDADEADSLAGL